MELNIKVIGKKVKNMVMEKCITLKILKKLVIKVNLETIKWRVKVNLFLKTNFMKVCLKKIFSMVKES